MSPVPGSLFTHPSSNDIAAFPAASSRAVGEHPRTCWDGEIHELRGQIDVALSDFFDAQKAAYQRHPFFVALYDDLAEFVCRPGKRLRPLLFLLGHRTFQKGLHGCHPTVEQEALRSIAISLELLHAFILVHDDIIDRAEFRRGTPTLHRIIEGRLSAFAERPRAGRNLALVMGDILFALAQKCLLEAALPPETAARLGSHLLGCMVETGFGEVADIFHGTRDLSKVGIDEIEQMYCLKTSCYTIEGPLTMAAVLAGADNDVLDTITRIAKPAGLAFQIQNDLEEFERFESLDAGASADLLEGKKTLLLRTAFERLPEADRTLLQRCFNGGVAPERALARARELIAKSGATGVLTIRMDELFAESHEEICWPGFSPAVRQELAGLLQLIRGWRTGLERETRSDRAA